MWRERSCHFNRRLRTDQRRLLAQTPGLQDAFTISINNYNSNAIIKRKDDTDYNNYLRIIILAKRKRKEKNLTFLNILTKPFEFRCRMFDSFTEQFPISCITSFILSVPKTVYRSQESSRPYHEKKKKKCWRWWPRHLLARLTTNVRISDHLGRLHVQLCVDFLQVCVVPFVPVHDAIILNHDLKQINFVMSSTFSEDYLKTDLV